MKTDNYHIMNMVKSKLSELVFISNITDEDQYWDYVNFEFDKSIEVELGTAVCTLVFNNNGWITVYNLRNFKMGNGHGSAILNLICEIADRFNLNLELTCCASCDSNLKQKELLDFYKRRGFVFKNELEECAYGERYAKPVKN